MIPADLVDAWLILVLNGFSFAEADALIAKADAEINDYLATYRSLLEAGREAR
jgi:hypothetical protein